MRARVLVVDDEEMLRSMLAAVLESAGHEVVGEACDGVAAVELAMTLRPDIVTMDLDMPRLSGFEATKQIVASRLATVVVVSGWQSDTDRAAALAAGARRFVSKRDAPSDLPTIVHSLLAQEPVRPPA
jgi:DNA-binding NarL/FixJ family response regulator